MGSDDDAPKLRASTRHDAAVRAVAFLVPDSDSDMKSRSVVYGFANGMIQRSRADGRTSTAEADGGVWVVATSSDAKYIVSGGEDGKITIWNSDLVVKRKLRSTSSGEKITALDVSPDSTTVASGSNDGELCLWNITSGNHLVGPLAAHSRTVRCIQFSPQGDRIATLADSEPSLRVWNSSTGALLLDVTVTNICALVWLSDERILAASETHTHCLDATTGSTLVTSPEGATRLAITLGRTMAVGLDKRDVRVWDADALAWGPPVVQHDYEPCSIALCLCDLVVGGDKRSSVWNLFDPEVILDPVRGFARDADLTICERFLTEMIALVELQAPTETRDIYFARAMIRSRMKKFGDALHDAEIVINAKLLKEGHLAKSVVLCLQGEYESAMQAFDLAFYHASAEDKGGLLLIKASIMFLSGLCDVAVSRVGDLMNLEPDETSHHLTLAQMLVLLAETAMAEGDYGRAEHLLTRAGHLKPFQNDSHWEGLSMITGWQLSRVGAVIYRQHCEVLLAMGRSKDAVDHFCTMMNTIKKDMEAACEVEWVADFKARCLEALTQHGDAAMGSGLYEDAIVHYTAALSFDPSKELLSKRSEARARNGSWDESLEDAEAAIELDPSSPCGYGRKHAALLGAHRYDEAIDAHNTMLLKLERSADPITRGKYSPSHEKASSEGLVSLGLRSNYVSPSQTKAVILSAVKQTQRDVPLVFINTETGRLYDQRERSDEFEADPKFKELVASMTEKLDNSRIKQVVQEYFRYATFSHTWEGAEPLFHDVLHESVHKLAASPTVLKLVMFCATAKEAGLRWAWCDTCCINKTDGSILQESLTSMFQWYHESSLTIVHLRGVLSDSELRALERCLWNTRAWTLQEFFASKVIRFYTEDWKPYFPNETAYNHKDSPAIMSEMARATGVNIQVLLSLRPGSENVRQKLRLAAMRIATKQEDIAYSLFGIFDVSIPVTYGEGQRRALGRLLQEVLTRSGDVTILAWTGKASDYNSSLPADISVYREPETPYIPSPVEESEMEARITELRTSSRAGTLDSAMALYDRIALLPSPRLVSRRLSLSCIMFPLRGSLVPNGEPPRRVYRTTTSAFGNVEIATAEDLSGLNNLVLVHPWLRCLLDPALPFEDPIMDDAVPLTPLDGDNDLDPLSTDALSPLSASSTSSQLDRVALALRLFVRLKQPFGALLLVPLSHNEYKRVASDHPIVVQLLKDVSPRYLAQKIRPVDIL